jgi:hypothetical protein
LRWSSINASTMYLNNIGYVTPNQSSSAIVAPVNSTDYSGIAVGSAGTSTCAYVETVTPPPAPTALLSLSQTTTGAGQLATLSWSSTNATSCNGTNFSTSNATSGATLIAPVSTTNYYVSCTGAGGTAAASTTLTVGLFSASPTTITQGQGGSLSWSFPNATSCAGTNFSSGNATSGALGISPLLTTIYSISCPISGGGTASASQQVNVTCTPAYTCTGASNDTITYTDASCNESAVTTCASPYFCSSGSAVCVSPSPVFNGSGNLTGHLQIKPTLLGKGASTKAYWSVSNVQSCTVTSTNGDSWSGLSGAGFSSRAIYAQTIFTLSCLRMDNGTLTEQQTVNLLPVYQEK